MRITGLPAAALLTAAVLLLGGCNEAPEPQGPPNAQEPPSTSASPSPSAMSPPPPVMPAAAKRKSKAGAEAFIRHYVRLINFAGSSGKTAELRSHSLRTCVKCNALIDGIDGVYANGGRIEGGGWTVVDVKHYGFANGYYFLDVTLDSAPQLMQKSASSATKSFPGASNRLRAFVLERNGRSWKVSELDPSA